MSPATTVDRPRPAPSPLPAHPGLGRAPAPAAGDAERTWLRPGFSLVAVGTVWYACDPIGRAQAVRAAAIPAGLAGPHEVDPQVHTGFVAGLAAAGVAVHRDGGRGLGRRGPSARPTTITPPAGRPVRQAGPLPTQCLLGGPALLVGPLLDLLGRAAVPVRRVAELPSVPPIAGSAVVWCGPAPFGPSWPALDAAAREGHLTWVRIALDGRWADLEPVARSAGDVTHGMTLQRRLAADRQPAVLRARWSATAVHGPAPLTPAVGRRLAWLVAADLGLPVPVPPTAGSTAPAARSRSGVPGRGRVGVPDVAPNRRVRRVDLFTGRWTDHPIVPVPPAQWRGAPA